MYENTTVLSNKEYAVLVIKAHKYDEMEKLDYKELIEKAHAYDQLRLETLGSSYVTSRDKAIFKITDEEIKAHRKQEG